MSKNKVKFPPLSDKYRINTCYYKLYDIEVVEGQYNIRELDLRFKIFEEAYNYIEQNLGGLAKFNAEDIADSDPDEYKKMHSMLVSRKTRRLFFSRSDAYEIDLAYKSFIRVAKKYLKNKNDFYYAYHFLSLHPMFWSLEGDLSSSRMLFWETDFGLEKMWHTVYKNSKNEVMHLLEHGPFIDDDDISEIAGVRLPARVATHDIRLDVVAKTYEKAIIRLAKRVNKFYQLNGEEKPTVAL